MELVRGTSPSPPSHIYSAPSLQCRWTLTAEWAEQCTWCKDNGQRLAAVRRGRNLLFLLAHQQQQKKKKGTRPPYPHKSKLPAAAPLPHATIAQGIVLADYTSGLDDPEVLSNLVILWNYFLHGQSQPSCGVAAIGGCHHLAILHQGQTILQGYAFLVSPHSQHLTHKCTFFSLKLACFLTLPP